MPMTRQPGWGYEARVIEQLAAVEEERDELRDQLRGAVEAERAEIVTLLQEIADAEPRMSECAYRGAGCREAHPREGA
jgi:hypothetical protein